MNTLFVFFVFFLTQFFFSMVSGEVAVKIVIGSFFNAAVFATLWQFLFVKSGNLLAEKLEKSITPIQLERDEKYLLESPASRIKGNLLVGGVLTLTDRRIVFRPHRFNVDRKNMVASIPKILVIGTDHKNKQVLKLEAIDIGIERFLVHNSKQWVNEIKGAATIV